MKIVFVGEKLYAYAEGTVDYNRMNHLYRKNRRKKNCRLYGWNWENKLTEKTD